MTPTSSGAKPIPTPKTVCVSDGYYNDSVKAFKELTALRDALAKQIAAGVKSDTDRAALEEIVKSLNELIVVKDRIQSASEQLIQTYQKIIQIQDQMIDKLQKQLSKPKSTFQKIMDVLKEITILAAGITIGHGL